MPWTWVSETFNRSNRNLDGDPVGASTLEWRSHRPPSGVAEPAIISNEPRPDPTSITSNEPVVLTDVSPLAGVWPVLGVGVEGVMVAPVTAIGGRYYHSWLAGWRPMDGLQFGMVVQTNGDDSSSTFLHSYEFDRTPVVTVGFVGFAAVGTDEYRSIGFSTQANYPVWVSGDVIRVEVVFGGATTVYRNGVVQAVSGTPSQVTSQNTHVGAIVGVGWRTDDWRVGVLTDAPAVVVDRLMENGTDRLTESGATRTLE